MAILTADQMTQIRNLVEKSGVPIDYRKTQINAAMQAVEDFFENTGKAAINNAIETACPMIFTAFQKKQIVKYWLLSKTGRE